VSWTKNKEEAERLQSSKDHLFRQFSQSAEEALPILLGTLNTSDIRWAATAIEVIDFIGYPRNECAIPALLACIGSKSPSGPVWMGALFALSHVTQSVLVPHLIRALLEKGEPYHRVWNSEEIGTSWNEDLEGLCFLLSRTNILESEYARQCSPTVHYLLAQADLDASLNLEQIDAMLDVLEEAGNSITYILPTLITIAGKYQENIVGKHAKKLIGLFPQEALECYKLVLS
jgi:hypothetical protein